MTDYSFTSFLNGASKTAGSSALRRTTEGQRRFYFDLCQRKRITPKDITKFSFDQLDKEIKELRNAPDPASQSQIDKINELTKELIELGADVNMPSDDFFKTLTGGREGSASALIQTLFNMRTKMNEIAPPSGAQLQIMIDWYLCPDIPFESFSAEEVYPMKEGANVAESQTITLSINRKVNLEGGFWRMMTPTEFAEELRAKLTKRQASKFIDKYRGVFYEWKKTRITENQINYIREIEARLNNMYTPQQVEWAVVNGEMQQITKPNTRTQYLSKAYEPMDINYLAQLSYEEASKLIDQLKGELEIINNIPTMHGEEQIYSDTQEIFEQNRQASNNKDALIKEFNKLNDLIYAVEAILGYENKEAHDIANEMMVNGTANDEEKETLRAFFLSTVTADKSKNLAEWAKESSRIYMMCEDCQTAMDILPTFEDYMANY